MSKRKWVAAKLFAVLGGAGLAFGLCVPRASAQVTPGTFSNSNYANRYICNWAAGDNFFTAFVTLNPNGTGTFVSGTMQEPISAPDGFVATLPPPANFCTFNLDVAGSSYLVATNGTGVEVLSWTAAATNAGTCAPTGTFMMSDSFVMRITGAKTTGAVVRTESTSDNLLATGRSGTGHCIK